MIHYKYTYTTYCILAPCGENVGGGSVWTGDQEHCCFVTPPLLPPPLNTLYRILLLIGLDSLVIHFILIFHRSADQSHTIAVDISVTHLSIWIYLDIFRYIYSAVTCAISKYGSGLQSYSSKSSWYFLNSAATSDCVSCEQQSTIVSELPPVPAEYIFNSILKIF